MLTLLLLLFAVTTSSETIPDLHIQSFADVPVSLPGDLHGKLGVLVLGFSKKSSTQTKAWNVFLLRDYANDPRIVYYQAAVLADAPSLLRGMIVKSIRSGTNPADRAHFLAIVQDGAAWKQAVHLAAPDDAYLLVIDSSGHILWRAHGPPTDESYRSFRDFLTANSH